MRLETEDGVLTYSAETGPGFDLAGFARGSDLLLCEATYQEGRVGAPVHLTAVQAGETARRAEARRLVLTHVWPAFDPRRSVEEAAAGGVEVHWAAPGASFEIRRG
jgi:ribonuclease BN (tRNA processing enzyme)